MLFSSHKVDDPVDSSFFLENLFTIFINCLEIHRALDNGKLLRRLSGLYLLLSELVGLLRENPIKD